MGREMGLHAVLLKDENGRRTFVTAPPELYPEIIPHSWTAQFRSDVKA